MSGRVLVTGGSGLVGQALLAALREGGADAVGLSSRDVDLTDAAATEAVFRAYRPEVVFHLAARVRGIGGNQGTHGVAYLENIRIGTNTIEAARVAGARKVIAMGSAAVYGDAVGLPMREVDIWTGAPHPSEAGYAHAKRAMLGQLEAYQAQWGLDYAYCVSTNLYGPGDRFDEAGGHVIPSLISKFHRAVREGQTVTVWGSGAPLRDFMYVKDAARALIWVGEAFSGAINVATGRAVSIREVVGLIAEVSGYRGEVVWDGSQPDGQLLRGYDVSRLASLGFAPRWGLREGLSETFAWFADNVGYARR